MNQCQQCGQQLTYGTSNSEKNPGRNYFKCDAKKGGCDFFVWEDAIGQPAKPAYGGGRGRGAPRGSYPARGRGNFNGASIFQPPTGYKRTYHAMGEDNYTDEPMQEEVPSLLEHPVQRALPVQAQVNEADKHAAFSMQLLHERLDRESSEFSIALRELKTEYNQIVGKQDDILRALNTLIASSAPPVHNSRG